MSVSIHRKPALPSSHGGAAAGVSLAELKAVYEKGVDKSKAYKEIADPEKDPSLKNTAALKLYKDTLGEGRNLDLCTDGDHLVFKAKTGELLVMTYPEDSSRGDELWVFDKSGQKQLAHGVALDGKLKWDAKK